jgi:hypothetical protein
MPTRSPTGSDVNTLLLVAALEEFASGMGVDATGRHW